VKISKVRVQNWKSFADSGDVALSDINVVVGRNNSGKSAFLRAIFQLQEGSDPLNSDIRLGATEGAVTLTLVGSDLELEASRFFKGNFAADGKNYATIELSANRKPPDRGPYASCFQRVIDPAGTPSRSFGRSGANEPNNFIYSYFSKRKVSSFDEQIDEYRTRAVAPDLRYLPAKVLRLNNPGYEGYEEYARLCEEVIGFHVGTYASENGQKVGISVGRYHHIPLEAMGEGVASQLGLIVNLCMANGNLFLIEEPENDVHPEGLKALLRVINEKAQYNQFVITTHSNVVMKGLGADSAVLTVDMDFASSAIPTSTISPVANTPTARISILRELGYELYDSDLYDGWLFLEESSAQVIIRSYLIPWFVPRLARIQTVAVNGVSKVEPTFEDFRRLFLFAHLEPQYVRRAWVVVDGDDDGKEAIEKLRDSYRTWPEYHFKTWAEENFEQYYPSRFADRVAEVLVLSHDEKRRAKRELLDDVKHWCEANRVEAEAELSESANEVIQVLREIDQMLFA
jgi:hypothetical protein